MKIKNCIKMLCYIINMLEYFIIRKEVLHKMVASNSTFCVYGFHNPRVPSIYLKVLVSYAKS